MAFPQDYAAAMTIYGKLKEVCEGNCHRSGRIHAGLSDASERAAGSGVCDSLDNGVIKLHNSISSRINAEYDVLLEETDMDQMILGKDTDYEPGIVRIVQEMAELLQRIFWEVCWERNMDLKSGCVVFVGGGASLLERYIRSSGKVGRVFLFRNFRRMQGYGILYRLQKGR
ncbi:MAG: hypothetical protein ACLSHX_17855 [Suilimivivens sp.]